MAKRINPAILPPLKEALSLAFWYRKDLRAFINSCLRDRDLVARLDWTDYKRNVVGTLVDTLHADQQKHFDDLLNLLLSTADLSDPAHLKRLEDGQRKYDEAVAALQTLREQVEPYRKLRAEEEAAERRRDADRVRGEAQRAITEKLAELRQDFYRVVSEPEQQRGYSLERFLTQLFTVYDIDAKSSFRVRGEQIDGAFTFEGTEFLLEAKWQKAPIGPADLDSFAAKVRRKLDNTLGLYLSMNGFQDTAVELHSQSRPVLILPRTAKI